MLRRIFVEKKKGFDVEAQSIRNDLKYNLLISGIEDVRVINRYDAENITEELFTYAKQTVFAEPQLDIATDDVDLSGATVFATEFLPGQFDQRADSAAQCIQIISQSDRPTIRTAKVYALYGELTEAEVAEEGEAVAVYPVVFPAVQQYVPGNVDPKAVVLYGYALWL